MIGTMLAWGSQGVGDFLNNLQDLGFFQYVLPFLLVFALVFAILSRIPIFAGDSTGKGANKGAAVLIALAVGILAIWLPWVPAFFQNMIPKFAIGLSLLLVALVLAGVFLATSSNDEKAKKAYNWIFFGLGSLIFIVIAISSLSSYQFMGNNWFNNYGALIVVIVVIIGAIVGVVLASKKEAG